MLNALRWFISGLLAVILVTAIGALGVMATSVMMVLSIVFGIIFLVVMVAIFIKEAIYPEQR